VMSAMKQPQKRAMSDLSDVEFMGCDAISNKVLGNGQHFIAPIW
jgi:hypothetical protein